MRKIHLVHEDGGSYDSAYVRPILAYESAAEAERAVKILEKEMRLLKRVRSASQRFNEAWTQGARRAEDRDTMWTEAQRAFEAEVRGILRVYPCDILVPSGDQRPAVEMFQIPDLEYDEVTFFASELPIGSLSS